MESTAQHMVTRSRAKNFNRTSSTSGKTAIGLAMAFVFLAGCKEKTAAPPPQPPAVLAEAVIQRDVPIYREWVAQLNGSVNAQISPKVSGYVIVRNYREGYSVAKGQVLFEIDPRPYQAALDQAKASVAQAQANFGNSRLNVARDTPLAKEKAIAQSQLDNDIQMMAANQASVDAALAQQRTAELNLEWTKVRSPIDGIAGVATSQVGDLVGTSTTMTSVSDVNPIRAYFNLSEKDYLWIAPTLSLIVHGTATSRNLDAGDVQYIQANGIPLDGKGRFVLVGREVSNGTGAIQMACEFDNKNGILRPGGFGRVRIRVRTQKDALLIPQRAVNEVQGIYQVAVLSPGNRAEIRNVTVGERTGEDWIVTQGLAAGDRVVVEGAQKLRNGTLVDAKPYHETVQAEAN